MQSTKIFKPDKVIWLHPTKQDTDSSFLVVMTFVEPINASYMS